MTIVILGAGRVGLQLARQLISEHKEVIVIEKDSQKAQDVSRQLDCFTVNDNGNSLEALEKARIEKADFFVSVTESDEINMIACALVSSAFKKPITIARVRNLDYSRTWNKKTDFLGIDYIINPEIEVAHAIVRAVDCGAVSSVVDFETSDLQMRNIAVEKGSLFDGMLLRDLRSKLDIPFIVAVIVREEDSIIPTGSTELKADDQLWVLAEKDHLTTLLKFMNKPPIYLKNIVIAGGGNIGMYIARFFLEEDTKNKSGFFERFFKILRNPHKRNVHIVESNYARCKELAELLPGVQITNADISEEQILEEGRFNTYDLLIAATGNQELNIVTAAHARKGGISRTMALVKKSSNTLIARNLGVDVAVSINETLVNSIQKIIRKDVAKSVYYFSDSNLELLEWPVSSHPEMAGHTIKELHLPRNSLIMMITREGKHLIPHGDLALCGGDCLMLITTKDNVRELE